MALVGPDLITELVASILGVFAGVLLALVVDHAGERRQGRVRAAEEARHLHDARVAILGSVVRNVSEAKRLKRLTASSEDPFLLGVAMETAVWDATRHDFLGRAPTIDERVTFTRFFDDATRIQRLVEFHRKLVAGGESRDEEGRRARAQVVERLQTAADDLQLGGNVVVTDYGEQVHKDMLGLRPREVA
ncbi:MAG TPA: hypothetical protein VI997_10665 [Candidatus Thermoplasmatota archaeon]|nr:hypothetical protein [Candidatus Thermoplasmatota archaeon]